MNNSATKYYDKRWNKNTGLQMVKDIAELGYSWCTQIPKGTCIDIGCGDGTNSTKLSQLGFNVLGCDISTKALVKAINDGISTKCVDLNSQSLPYKQNCATLVWMTDVIEHVIFPNYLLAQIYSVLKPGGYLYLSTPNFSWLFNRLQVLYGKTPLNIHPEHISWYNLKELVSGLSKNNFKISDIKAYNQIIPHPIINRFPLLGKLNHIGQPNNLFSHTYAILAYK